MSTLSVLLQTNVAATLVKMEVHAVIYGFPDATVQRDIRALIVKWVRRTLFLLTLNTIKKTYHACTKHYPRFVLLLLL